MVSRFRNNRRAQLLLAVLAMTAALAGELRRTRMSAQAAVVGQPGVLAAHGFEEGTGTSTADSTGNNNTGTLASTAWTTAGKYGKALSFNGTSSRVNVADSAVLDLTVGMTLEAWVNPSSLTDWHSVIMKETATGLAYALYAHDGAHPAGYIHVGSSDIDVSGPTALPVNAWSHLAATYDGATFRLYVNGAQVASRAVTGAIATSANPLRIGGNQPWGESFAGSIDEVRVYGRALTAAEVQADMSSPIVALDSTPPTVTLVSPANGSTGVIPSANVTATFSEAMTAGTIGASTFELRNASNQLVTAAVTYDAATFSATLDPAADLTAGATYTATIRGGAADPRAKDAAGNPLAASVVWSFTVRPADTTPPTVTSVSPAGGATGVAVSASVSALFSEAMDASTINGTTFELRNASNQLVTGTVSYNAGTQTATLVPSVPLANGATYTASVRGGAADPRVKDAAGNALATTASWSFSTPPPPCPCSIWSASATPTIADYADTGTVELGVRFQSDRAGFISGVRFYKGAGNTGQHTGSLWTATGTVLASAVFTSETASGWQQVDIVPPVAITANTVYVVSYHAPVGHYAADVAYFGNAVDAPPLHALADGNGGNGVYLYAPTSAFPNQPAGGANYWVDAVFVDTVVQDTAPPVVTNVSPVSGATGVSAGGPFTASFNEPIDQATLGSSTIELRTSGGTLIPTTLSYNAAARSVSISPSVALAAASAHTITIRGGAADPRVKDLAGNALAGSYSWSFTTAPLPPDDGPGGPILVVASTINGFSRYYGEILRNEGLNLFKVTDISLVNATMLAGYDVVILGDMPLSAAQVTMFTTWVNGGGNLIAMRPDKQLAGLLGLADATGTSANQYLLVDSTGPGNGIVNQTMQYHGTADRYLLNGASALGMLYSDASTATVNPAVTLNSVGGSGGQAAAFTFDLARSVVYTRQGNPAWSGQERDGTTPIRSDDLFFGAAAGDVRADWVDLNKVAIPQADEQQRLLVNLILQMSADRKPLPRFWYLPRGLKAAVVMTGDDHANGGTAGRWDAYKAASPANCSVTDWQCIRATSYIYTSTPLTPAQAAAYTADGFEVGLHITTQCADYTPASLASIYVAQLAEWAAKYTTIPLPSTNRTHCIAWSDYDTQPQVALANGIRFDTNYYYWPGAWVLDRPGLFTGSGMPMRFAKIDGSTIDVYQAATQMTDESSQSFPFTVDTLLDRALGVEGYYGVFTANMHTDTVAHAASDAIVTSAKARGVPVVSSQQMLAWLDGRNASAFTAIGWNGTTMTFTVTAASGSTGLQGMLPAQMPAGPLTSLSVGATPVSFAVQTIKGTSYAVFAAQGGAYTAGYGPPDTAITSSPAASTTSTSATFTFTSTPAGATFQCSLDNAGFTACTSPQAYAALGAGSHNFRVRAVNGAGTDPSPASFTWTITSPPDTTITSSPAASTTSTSATFTFTSTPTGATFQCALDAAAFATCTSPRSLTGLALGTHTFQVRAVNANGTDQTPASFTWTITSGTPGGLVAAYGFEEGTGTTTADSSGSGNTGTLTAATWSTSGRFGKALSFNGTSAWVTVADANSLDLTNAMTIEAWVNPTSLGNWRSILTKETASGLAYSLYGSDGSRPAAYVHVGANDVARNGTAALAANAWTHVAATYDGTTLRLYINGTQVGTTTTSGPIATSTGVLRIGGNGPWGEFFSGLIDEVRVYSRVLTAAEIATDMNTPVKP